MAGWNVVLLQLVCITVLQDKYLITVYIFIWLNWLVNLVYRI